MDLEEESHKSRSLDGGNEGSGISHDMERSDEIRDDFSGEIIPEGLHRLPDATITDPSGSAFESSVEAVWSPPLAASPMRFGTVLVEADSRNSPPSATAEVDSRSPVLKKGNEMRKWRRRIRRDLKKDGSSSADSAQILKRRINYTEPSKRHQESKMKGNTEAEGEDSVPSVESRNTDIDTFLVDTGTLDPELEFMASSGFSIGMDSDNSEDHSSKSSTAASAPRLNHDALRTGRDRGKVKNFGGKGSTRLGPLRAQQGRGATVDSSKKIRDDLARFEKENSLSSVESDLRSSVIGIVQWGNMVNSNGKHKGRSSKLDEHSDEAHTGEEVQSGYYKENSKAENLFREDSDGKLLEENNQNGENCQSSCDLDPFIKSMLFLQEAQEVLEKEIEKIGAIGKEQVDNDKLFEGMESSSSLTLEAHLVDLKEKVEILESKLEEASTTIKAKEQKLCELESVLSNSHSPKVEYTSMHASPMQQHEEEATSELELLLKLKMEAEIEYFILTRTTENFKILSDDHIALFNQQKHLASDQEQTMLKLRDAEEKTIKLSEQTHMLEEYCKELAGMENMLRLQNKACKISLCFIVQLMLFFIALGLFLMHLLSPSDWIVPT